MPRGVPPLLVLLLAWTGGSSGCALPAAERGEAGSQPATAGAEAAPGGGAGSVSGGVGVGDAIGGGDGGGDGSGFGDGVGDGVDAAGSAAGSGAGVGDGAALPGGVAAGGVPAEPRVDVHGRPLNWAQSLPDRRGLPNLFQVTDNFYRGAQPEDVGFSTLREMGVRTVINLRTFHSDRSECAAAGLDYEKVSVQAWEAEQEEVLDVLRILRDPTRQPVFLHCQHGADRTGMMVALYRIVEQGWSRDEAIAEMTTGGYGYHSVWTNLVSYMRNVDVDELKLKLDRGW